MSQNEQKDHGAEEGQVTDERTIAQAKRVCVECHLRQSELKRQLQMPIVFRDPLLFELLQLA